MGSKFNFEWSTSLTLVRNELKEETIRDVTCVPNCLRFLMEMWCSTLLMVLLIYDALWTLQNGVDHLRCSLNSSQGWTKILIVVFEYQVVFATSKMLSYNFSILFSSFYIFYHLSYNFSIPVPTNLLF